MNGPLPKKKGGSLRILAWAMLVIVLWHVLLWLITLPRQTSASIRKPPDKQLYEEHYLVWQPSFSTDVTKSEMWNWSDPTIYLLPSDMGFSASMRLVSASPPVIFESPPPPVAMLPFEAMRENETLSKEDVLTRAEMLQDDFEEGIEDGTVEATPKDVSVWRVLGHIAERQPSPAWSLPVITRNELLAASFLRVGVSARGDPQFVTTERSSGYEKADEDAIRFVKALRFAPVNARDSSELEWGFVKILWKVERPANRS